MRNHKSQVTVYFVAERTQTNESATAKTQVVSNGNANGDLVSSATANTEDKEVYDTDQYNVLKYVSSQLSSLYDEINKLKGIVDKALQIQTESSKLSSRGKLSLYDP